jgi:hypothetical protein
LHGARQKTTIEIIVLELGFLYSGEIAPVNGVFKGRHTCGRNCCYAVWTAGKPLPFCVDCGLIRFSLFLLCPTAESLNPPTRKSRSLEEAPTF